MPIRMPRGERHADPAGVGEHPQPYRRLLVRRAVVRPRPGWTTAARGRLQHHAHARRDRPQPLQLRPGQHARVQVRQQPGLLQHRDRARPAGSPLWSRSRARRATSRAAGQRSSGRSPRVNSASLQPWAAPGPGDRQDLVAVEERRRQPVRHGGERAVVAPVAAQPGQRDEDLPGVRHHARPAGRRPGRRRGRAAAAASSSSSAVARGRPAATAASVTSRVRPSLARRSARRTRGCLGRWQLAPTTRSGTSEAYAAAGRLPGGCAPRTSGDSSATVWTTVGARGGCGGGCRRPATGRVASPLSGAVIGRHAGMVGRTRPAVRRRRRRHRPASAVCDVGWSNSASSSRSGTADRAGGRPRPGEVGPAGRSGRRAARPCGYIGWPGYGRP